MKKTSKFFIDYAALRDVDMPIEDIDFPEISLKVLKSAGIPTLRELLKLNEYELRDTYKFSHIAIDGITEKLYELNRDKE